MSMAADAKPTQVAICNEVMPTMVIKFEGTDGKQLAAPIAVRVPAELSLRVASMHLLEYVPKQFKAKLPEALKAMGFK